MAVTATNLTTAMGIAQTTSYTSSSVTPAANSLVLLWVYSIAGTAPVTPTITGNGLTWVQVAQTGDGSGLRTITLFRSLGASPTTGALTIDFGVQAQQGVGWSYVQYSGMNTTGTNGSGAIVQSATANTAAANATSLTVTLAAFGSVNNATVGGFGIPLNTVSQPTVGTGFTATGQANQSTTNTAIGSEFNAGNDTTVDMNAGAASIPWAGIAAEIAMASAGGVVAHNLTMMGCGA